ncbi:unnamed protein product, partial [Ascophyllum nodosum]
PSDSSGKNIRSLLLFCALNYHTKRRVYGVQCAISEKLVTLAGLQEERKVAWLDRRILLLSRTARAPGFTTNRCGGRKISWQRPRDSSPGAGSPQRLGGKLSVQDSI